MSPFKWRKESSNETEARPVRRGGKRDTREFSVTLVIHKLLAMPCTNAKFSCRWKMPREVARPNSGETGEYLGIDQDVVFNYEGDFSVRILSEAGAKEYLVHSILTLEVRSNDPDPLARSIGLVMIDLSHFAGIGKRTNRYLLQDAKCNGMLEVSLWLRQTAGDNIFLPPRGENPLVGEDTGSAFKEEKSSKGADNQDFSQRVRAEHTKQHTVLEPIPELPRELSESVFLLRYHEALPEEVIQSRGNPKHEVNQIFKDLHEQRASAMNTRELDPRMFQFDYEAGAI